MAPQAPRRKAPVVRDKTKPTRKLRPGDLVCGQCGEANSPSRKFCARCGTSLESAQKVKTPWWRKIIPRRKPKTLEVGERPGRGGNRGPRKGFSIGRILAPLQKVIVGLLVVGMLLFGFFPSFRTGVVDKLSSAKDRVERIFNPQPQKLPKPLVQFASSQTKDHPANAIKDGDPTTFWQAQAADKHPALRLKLSSPSALNEIQIRNGTGDNKETNIDQNFSAKQIEIDYVETGQIDTFQLTGDPKQHTHTLHHGGKGNGKLPQTILLKVLDEWQPGGANPQLTMAEITFYVDK